MKKKTIKKSRVNVEMFELVLEGIYARLTIMDCRLDKINEQLVALRNKDAEVIDLDKEVEKSRHMKDIINDSQRLVAYKYLNKVDDSEEVGKPNAYKVEYAYEEWLSLKEVDMLIQLIEGRKPRFSKKKMLDRLNRLRISLLPW